MFKNLIFDWSGTLVNDFPPTLDATNAVLRYHGAAEMGEEEFRQRFRLPYPEFYQEVLPEVPISGLEDLFREAFYASPHGVPLLEGAQATLGWCREREIRCFVLSSMDAGVFEKQARELKVWDYFEDIHAGVIDKRERIGEILAKNELSPQETAFLGDMVHDVETAKYGGVFSVALLTGYDPEERLRQAEPDLLVNDLLAFRKWMEESQDE